MENDVLITEENMYDLRDQDLEGLKALLDCEELNINTSPEPLELKSRYKPCYCGNHLVQESPKGEYRCSQCGRIKYEGVKK